MLDQARPILERRVLLGREYIKRTERKKQQGRGGLINFVRYYWHIVEPNRELIEGWMLDAVCQHLEAVTFGEINRLLINVSPGTMKSLLTNVFWPAWMWGPLGLSDKRFVSFAYAASLTERDNNRFRDVIMSPEYAELWGDKFALKKIGETRISNDKTGWKLATSVGGVSTGERGDIILLDDPHSVKEGESEVIRNETVRWFREAMSNRLNDMDDGAIVIIMQRVHESDVSGVILEEGLNYTHLCVPMEFDESRRCETEIGWSDPRTYDGELAWPERFSAATVEEIKTTIGPYAYAGQYQQTPKPRGGAIFRAEWWQVWDAPDKRFPTCDYIVASLDPAYTAKKQNDPSGFTVWGVFKDQDKRNKIILMYAWRKRLEMHGPALPRERNEPEELYLARVQPQWGLVEWVAWSCRTFKVDRLLIEAKASGLTAAQELRRLYFRDDFGVELINPKNQDKVNRANAVVHLFAAGLIYAPLDKAWADMVINEMESFPTGKHDDLVDSATQAIQHLRANSLAIRPDEQAAYDADEMMLREQTVPLYDV